MPTYPHSDDDARPASEAETPDTSSPDGDPALEALQEILLSRYSKRVAQLETELDDLERRITDKDAFVAMVTPVLGDAIRRKIRDARDEMIEALYPIIGQTVVRAVSEAIRDLARTIDAQMRTTFNLQSFGRRLRAQASGVSSAEMVLRESLPFDVAEIFLIHRESGLLLWHLSRDPEANTDSDLISGMLTAIRNFVAESFGQGEPGDLDEIQYGERRILIEAAQYAYLAVVIDGIEPPGFRAEMRERLIEVDYAHEGVLKNYQGDPTPLAPVEEPLGALAKTTRPNQLGPAQKRVLAGIVGVGALCFLGSCLAGVWGWQIMQSAPTPAPVVIQPTATPTFTQTPSPTFTVTPSPTPTPTATFTPTPTPTFTPTATPTSTTTPTPSPVVGMMTGNVWLRQQPVDDSERLGVVLERGQPVEILAVFGDWYRIRWAPQSNAEVVGWAPAEWVGILSPPPDNIITPVAGP